MYVFKGNGLLVNSGTPIVPARPPRDDYRQYGDIQVVITEDNAPEGYEYRDFRWLGAELGDRTMAEVSYAYQIHKWDISTQFCGRCGGPNTYDVVENAKICPACGHQQYPAQFPVAIVAITREDKLLLAHNATFPEGMFSVIAGYVDLGESVEETVHREVMEEVGLKVRNLRYFGSQNWASSTALMLGFQAEWESGEIRVDGKEITEAAWFGRHEMPAKLPMPAAISGRLIAAFREKQNQD